MLLKSGLILRESWPKKRQVVPISHCLHPSNPSIISDSWSQSKEYYHIQFPILLDRVGDLIHGSDSL